MVDKIDDLITSLKQLKEEKLSSEEKSLKVLNLFKAEKENFNKSVESIYEKIDSLKNDVNTIDQKRREFFGKLDSLSDFANKKALGNSKSEKATDSQIKIFFKQESLLSELMKKNNYKTIYNIFISFLLINIAIYAVQGVIEDKVVLNFSNLISHFDCGLQLIKLMLLKQIFAFVFIIIINTLLLNFERKQVKKINLIFIVSLKISFVILFSLLKPNNEFSMFIRIVHFIDNLRCLFKVISYYIEKVLLLTYKNLTSNSSEKTRSDESSSGKACILIDSGDKAVHFEFGKISLSKEIKNFFYFYYAPTLIYRDVYPRTKNTNVFMIFIHLINLIFAILFLFLIIELKFFHLTHDKNFEFLKKDFILTLVTFCLYSMILLFVIFFGFFHSYFNLLAEILRFADKNFYSDFYNSLNPNDFMLKLCCYYDDFFEFYLTNILKAYIPKEFGKILLHCVFLEYILSSSMNGFCPVIAFTMLFCYFASFPFKLIDIHQKQYLNWLFVTFFTGFSFLVLFFEYIIKLNGNDKNYIASYLDENMQKNYVFAWLLPKIVFIMF